MCLVFLAVNQRKDCPLLVLFNRDEQYTRPTGALSFWEDAPHVLGGRDHLRGGTWAGVRSDGAFACVTFVREAYTTDRVRRSRGLLVAEFLRGQYTPEAYLNSVRLMGSSYWGFNFVIGKGSEVFHHSNRSGRTTRLEEGIHGVSNAGLNDPWPKVRKGRERLSGLLTGDSLEREGFLSMMCDDELALDAELPSTGVPLDKERQLSAMFVRMPTYGTRTTSLIQFADTGAVEFTEWTHEPGGGRSSTELTLRFEAH